MNGDPIPLDDADRPPACSVLIDGAATGRDAPGSADAQHDASTDSRAQRERAPGGTPVSPAGETPPDQDSEPPRTADDGSEDDASGAAPPASHPASPGALH